MKAEFIKIFKIFEELEEAGECATLTISSRKGISSIKLLLEAPSSSPTTASTPTTLPSASGRRRRHRGAAARARRRQRAADHQATLLEAPSSVPSPPAPGVTSDPAGHPLNILPSPSPTSGRRSVTSLGRPPPPSFGSLNLDGPAPSPPLQLPRYTTSKRTGILSIVKTSSESCGVIDPSLRQFGPKTGSSTLRPNWGRGWAREERLKHSPAQVVKKATL